MTRGARDPAEVARLYEEAKALLIADQRALDPDLPVDMAEIEEMIGTPADPDIAACIEAVLDPDAEPPDSRGLA